MTGISSALSNALSGLLVSTGQTVVTSRNITRANDESYSREIAAASSNAGGSATLLNVQRVVDSKLLASFLKATSDTSGQSTLLSALTTLGNTVGDVERDGSIAWAINQFQQRLQAAEADPGNTTLGVQAIAGANALVGALNSASQATQSVRNDSNVAIVKSVSTINELLGEFQKLDNAISAGSLDQTSRVVAMDSRDEILKRLASEIGIQVVSRADDSIAIYTDGGVTLFDRSARPVSVAPLAALDPGVKGEMVYVDGVPILGPGSPMPSKSGNIVANAKLRDQVAPTYQTQLDEIARTLISSFSESDQSAVPTLPDATGLFVYSGSPAVPGTSVTPGLATDIKVNAAFDPAKGGSILLLRDGGSNGVQYKYNVANVSGFQGRLNALTQSLDKSQVFSASTGLPTTNNIQGFAQSSAGWVEGLRSDSSSSATSAQATHMRAKAALLSTTGVNLDSEMSTMLNLEKSYQASAKVLTTIYQMLGELMDTVR